MSDLTFRLVVTDNGVVAKLQKVEQDVLKTKNVIENPSDLYVLTENAHGKLTMVKKEAEESKDKIEEPAEVKVNAAAALGTIRDLTVAVAGAVAAVQGLGRQLNNLLDSEMTQRRAGILTDMAFKYRADEMRDLAKAMQEVTNYADQQMLPLFAQLAATYKLTADEVKQLLPGLIDFTEANASAGMNLESAFRMFGRALGGNLTLLKRYGIELDESRLEMEGASYIAEVLAEHYGGVAEALADLRIQNRNTWTDIKEDIGAMLRQIVTPLMKGVQALMKAFQGLPPVVRGIVAGLVIAIPVIVTTTTVITTLTVAVAALKTVINPVTGIIAGVVAGLTTLGLAVGAATMKVDAASTAVETMDDKIQAAGREVATEAEKFSMLANRLLELRGATNRTAQEQQEMKNIIDTMNKEYGEHLNNVNLETAGYNQLADAINRAGEALVQKKIAEVYGETYNVQLRKVAELKIQLQQLQPEYEKAKKRWQEMTDSVDWNYMTSDANPAGFNPAKWFGKEYNQVTKVMNDFGALGGKVAEAESELRKIGDAYREAAAAAQGLTYEGGKGSKSGGGYTGRVVGNVDQGLRDFQRLMEELDRVGKTAMQLHDEEYDRRFDLISKYTKSETEERKQAWRGLIAWNESETRRILKDEKSKKERAFKDQIDYYSNLQSLGVSCYDALKQTMEEYYEWAQKNLPEKEQQLILAQMSEANLRWGEHLAEKEAELERARQEFGDRDLELSNQTYQLQLLALERYYAQRKATMIEAGLTEQELERQKRDAIMALNKQWVEQGAQAASQFFGNLASAMDRESERGFKTWQALASAQAMVDTFSAANAAYKAMAGIPGAGPALGAAAAAAAIVAGLANVRQIWATEFKPKAETGGYLVGPSHARGGIDVEAEGGEYFVARHRVAALGKGLFDFLNFGPLAMVKSALAGLQMPVLPLPASPGLVYASGGMVQGGGGLGQMMEAMMAKLEQMGTPVVNVTVDPLSNDPVKISRIADKGKKLRSGY